MAFKLWLDHLFSCLCLSNVLQLPLAPDPKLIQHTLHKMVVHLWNSLFTGDCKILCLDIICFLHNQKGEKRKDIVIDETLIQNSTVLN